MKNHSLSNLGPLPLWKIWLLFFLFTLLVAALVQLVIVPRIIPTASVEQGLLIAGDSVSFHILAVKLSQKIQVQGWDAWLLWPAGQGPAGVAAAIYAVSIPEPWVLIPLNAALHATSGILVILILELFIDKRRVAFWSSIPFVIFPSAVLWYAQIYKDSYTIPGSLMFILGWAWIARVETWKSARIVAAISFVIAGSGLIWIMRPYEVEILQFLVALLCFGLLALYAVWLLHKKWIPLAFMFASLVTVVLVVSLTPFVKNTPITNTILSDFRPVPSAPLITDWQPGAWLPASVEQKLQAFGETREHYIQVTTGSTDIDKDVRFRSLSDMLRYLPRGIQIGLFAPFPSMWFGQGTQFEGTLMRRISIFEMLFVYVGLAASIFMFWRFRTRPDFWLVVYLCVSMILFYSMVVVNIGTLYRFRYAFLMTLVCIGFSSIIDGCFSDCRKFPLKNFLPAFMNSTNHESENMPQNPIYDTVDQLHPAIDEIKNISNYKK
jgi:hypothetical protein